MDWYKRVYTDDANINKITELPTITQWIQNQEMNTKIQSATEGIFNDTFSSIYGSIGEEIYKNPANVSTEFTFKDRIGWAIITAGDGISHIYSDNHNGLLGLGWAPVKYAGKAVRSGWNYLFGTTNYVKGGSTTTSRKPKNKNKKTKKFIRDKR